jgi:polyhydroxyalkanoate synthesis regulator phasin
MKEVLKNILYIGVGAAFLTREKLEDLGKELAEKSDMTRDEGKQFIDDLLKKSDGAKEQLEHWVNRSMEDRLKKCNMVGADEIEALRRQVDELQRTVDSLSQAQTGRTSP